MAQINWINKKKFFFRTHTEKKSNHKIKNEIFSPFLVECRQFTDAIRARVSDEKKSKLAIFCAIQRE